MYGITAFWSGYNNFFCAIEFGSRAEFSVALSSIGFLIHFFFDTSIVPLNAVLLNFFIARTISLFIFIPEKDASWNHYNLHAFRCSVNRFTKISRATGKYNSRLRTAGIYSLMEFHTHDAFLDLACYGNHSICLLCVTGQCCGY